MCTRKVKNALLTPIVFLFLVHQAFAQDATKWVYKVRIAGSKYSKGPIIQSGFRLKGTKGIVTALHGVINGKDLSANNDLNELLMDLRILKVDFNRDIALLISDELLAKPAEGLELGQIDSVSAGQLVHVLGSPRAIDVYDKRVFTGTPVFKTLRKMIPPQSSETFHKRKSPFEDIDVLNIDGALSPGHSGAPVVDSRGRVLGVVDGGIVGVDIGWAIPIKQIAWKKAIDEKQNLDHLARVDPSELFAFITEALPEHWQLNVAGASTRRDLRDMSYHLGVDHPITLLGINCKYGMELGILVRHVTTSFATLPGLNNATQEETYYPYFISLYGGVVPFDWEWFNPSVALLAGYPLNLQMLVTVRLIKLQSVAVSGEWRTMYYNFENDRVAFNIYGNSKKISRNENTIQTCLGLCFSWNFDLTQEEGN